MSSFSPSHDELRDHIEGCLSAFLADRRGVLEEAAPLIDELERMIHLGGKRLRPAFCYWAFRACGGTHGPEIVRSAASLELLHTFAIVHDDIMDASATRRGAPTVHAAGGLAVGILAGDLALVLADHLFVTAGFSGGSARAAFDAYSRMRQQVIAGQYLDVRSAEAAPPTAAEARRLAVLKSALYTVEEPLLIGALLAGRRAVDLHGWARFGRALGEAFQLVDDIAGVFGSETEVGKPVDSDVREGKRNLLFVYALEGLTADDRDELLARWGRGDDLSGPDVQRARDLVAGSGARARTEELIRSLYRDALNALDALGLGHEVTAALDDLARRAVHPYGRSRSDP
ncbi:MAG: polyprenyl synthetase family protein [Actinomycetota bacterium]